MPDQAASPKSRRRRQISGVSGSQIKCRKQRANHGAKQRRRKIPGRNIAAAAANISRRAHSASPADREKASAAGIEAAAIKTGKYHAAKQRPRAFYSRRAARRFSSGKQLTAPDA